MNILEAIILSMVEGITEFLPVSSTGHLILTADILGLMTTPFLKTFEISIQSGAISAVLMLYAKKILRNPSLIKPIILGFIPSAIAGLLFYDVIKNILLNSAVITVAALGLGGAVLILVESILPRMNKMKGSLETITSKQAIFIGIAQSFSIIPGVSRAAATIVGGMLTGLSRESSVEFSFLLAVPTILGATVLDLVKTGYTFTSQEYLLLGIGYLGAFVSATFAVKTFLAYIKKHTLTIFGWYRILLALLFILWAIRLPPSA